MNLSLIIAMLSMSILLIVAGVQIGKEQMTMANEKDSIKFDKDILNHLQSLSFVPPFSKFIDEKHDKFKEEQEKITKAELTHLFSARSFTTLKVLLLMFSVFIYIIITNLAEHINSIIAFLLNIETNFNGFDTNSRIIFIMMLLILCLIPNILVKNRIKQSEFRVSKDIPMIQMFVILMLRSNRTTSEIIYSLSMLKSEYRPIFEVAYRIYTRSSVEGFEYLRESFKNTDFETTLNVLEGSESYSKQESINVLDNSLKELNEKNLATERRRDISNIVYSQAAISIPFTAVILLVIAPLAVLGISIFEEVGILF